MRKLTIGTLTGILAAGCSIPFVSEQEIAIEADQQFSAMRAEMPVSTDVNIRRYVFCVAENIIAQLEEPYASLDWEIEIFEDEAVNAFAMPCWRRITDRRSAAGGDLHAALKQCCASDTTREPGTHAYEPVRLQALVGRLSD